MRDEDSWDSLASEPLEQVSDLVDVLLWGFADPRFWLSESEVRHLAEVLRGRPDADAEPVREAIANCAAYLRVACHDAHLRLAGGT
ncbi:hypothetical protein [Trinickia acidisoli]|uniref:hypothetical protein n=1 Tax=Trinickia acidisoli TaxID=2767482 RepID=UPI001A8F0CEE|nr:hypothetical protein [Trinickia acidisoli]